jgi:hypothetical protein
MQRNEIRNGVIAVVQEKTGTEVFVPLHPALARAIKAGPSKGVYLVGDKNGRPITRRSLTVLISAAVKRAGLVGMCVAHGLGRPRYGDLRNMGDREADTGCIRPQVACRN